MTPEGRLRAVGWDDLLDRAGNGDPFRRADVLEVLAAGVRDVRVVAGRRDGRVVSAAVLTAERRLGLTELRTLGPPSNLFDPDPPAPDRDAARALVDAFRREGADVVTLPEVRPGSHLHEALREVHTVRERPEAPTFRVRAEDAPRLAVRRREAGRLARRAERRGTRVEVDTLSAWRDVRAALGPALAMHRARWSGPEADPLVGTEDGRVLVRRMLEAIGADGRLRLTRIRHDGVLAAFALAAVCPGGAVMYRTARDMAHRDGSGLGATAVVASIDALLDEGVPLIDLGSGGDAFKRHLADPEPVVTLQVGLSAAGRAFIAASAVRSALRRGPRRGRPSPRVGFP